MKRINSGTAIAVILASAAATQGWTGARGQGIPVSSAPPVVAANANTRIDVTSGGTPIVNIATPREDGTSYNVFSKLNVGKEGLIFNNSKDIGKSQIGGQVLANSRLKNSGEASLILNEVTGGTRSDLRGALEVFGGRASLVIANPSGITCDGCGFINVSRAALSTGKITFGADGEFTGFAVDGGDVRIEGQGLLAGNVDFFDIVTGSAVINANLFARDLVISGGSADFDYASRSATARGTGNDRLAIDSSLLGGMYANRIRLIGTGKGVGINLQGLVNALEGPLTIDADGAITVKSAASASDVTIASKANVNIDERVYGAGATRIDAAGNIVLAGDFVGAANSVSLKSGGDIRLGGAGLYAGLSSAGRFDQAGTLTINAAGSVEANALRAISSEGINLSANNATLGKESAFSARDISVRIGKSLISDASIEATGNLALSGDALQLGGDLIANGALAIDGRTVSLSGRTIGLDALRVAAREALGIGADGDLQTAGTATLSGVSVDNAGRVLGMAGAVVDASGTLTNSGAILSGGDAALTSGGDVSLGGTVNANGKTSVSAGGKANVTGTLAAAGDLALNGASIAADGTLSSGANLAVTTGGALTSGAASVIVADGAATFSAQSLDASGYISAGKALDLSATDALALKGQTHAGGALGAKAADITLGGVTVSDRDISLVSSGALSASGAVSAAGALSAKAASIVNTAGAQLVAGDALSLTSATNLTNAGALSGKRANLSAGASLTNSGTLYGADALNLSANTMLGQSGTAESGKALTLAAEAITLSGKTLGMDGVSATAKTISATGNLQSGGTLTLDAHEGLETAGSILAVGELTATSGAGFIQAANITLGKGAKLAAIGSFTQNGTVEAGGSLDLSGASVAGSGALFSDASISIRALGGAINLTGDLSAKSGLLFATPQALSLSGNIATDSLIDISASDVSVSGDVVASAGFLARITGGLAVTAGGKLRSGTDLGLDVTSIDNRGLIAAVGPLTLTTRANLISAGLIMSEAALSLRVGRDLTSAGSLQAGGTLSAIAVGTADLGGTAAAAEGLALAAERIVASGTLASGGNADLRAANAIDVTATALISAQKNLILRGATVTNAGDVISDATLGLTATGALTNSGALQSGADLALAGGSISLGGTASSLGVVTARTTGDIALNGAVSARTDIALDGANLASSTATTLSSARDIRLNASGAIALSGTVGANGAVALSGNSIALAAGSDISGGTLALSSRGALALAGDAISGAAASLSAAGDLSLRGTLGVAGAVDIAAARVDVAGALQSNSQIQILARLADIRIGGVARSAGDLRITSATAIDLAGSVQADAALTLRSERAGVSGEVIGVGGVDIATTGDISSIGNSRLISGGALTLSGGSVDLGGQTRADGNFALTTGGALSVSDNLFSGDRLSITAGSVDLASAVQAAQGLTISALGRLGIARDANLLSGGSLSLDAQGIASHGSIASVGIGRFTARDTITNSGRIDSSAALNFAAGNLALGGTIASGAGVTANAADTLSLGGTLSAKAGVALDGGTVGIEGTLLTQAGAAIRAGGTLEISGVASADGEVDLSATELGVTGQIVGATGLAAKATNINLGASGNLQSGRTLSLDASQGLTLDGTLLALDALSLSGVTRLDINNSVQSGAKATLATDGALTVRGSVSASDDISARGANISLSGTLSSGGAVNISAVDATVTGRLAAARAIDVTATGAATLGNLAVLESDGSIAVKGANLTTGGSLLGGTTAVLEASKTLDQQARVEARDSVTFSSNGALSNSGTVLTLGSVVIAGGATDLGGEIEGSRVSVNADSIRVRGKLAAGETLDLIAANALTTDAIAALASGAAFGISAGTSATIGGTIDAGTTLSVAANDALNLVGTVQSGSDATLSGQSIALDGTLASLGSATLNARNLLGVSGTLSATQGIAASAGDIALARSAQLISNQAIALTSLGSLTSAATVSALGEISLDAGARLTNSGALSSAAGIALSGNGLTLGTGSLIASDGPLMLASRADLVTTGNIDARGATSLSAATSLDQGAALRSLGATRLTAGGALTGSGSIETTQTLDAAAGSIALGGALTADGAASLHATAGDISLGGALASVQGLSLRASGDVSLLSSAVTDRVLSLSGRDINVRDLAIGRAGVGIGATRAVSLFTNAVLSSDSRIDIAAASLSNDGALSAQGAIDAAVTGALVNAGLIVTDGQLGLSGADISNGAGARIQSGGALTLSGSGSVSLAGRTTSGAALSISGGRLDVLGGIDSSGALSLTGSGAATLAAGSSLVSDTRIAARSGGAFISAGDIFSAGTTRLEAGGALSLGGTLQSVGSVNLSGGALDLGGAITTDALFDAATAGNLALSGTLQARDAITLSGGASDFAGGSALRSGASIAVTAATLSTRSTIDAATTITINSAADLLSTGDIASGGALTLSTGGSLTQNGALDSGGLLSLAGAAVSLNNLAIGVGGIAVEGGSLSLGGAADLRSGAGLALTSRGALASAGRLSASGDVTALAAGNFTQNAAITGNGAVTLDAGGTLTNSGNIDAARAIALSGSSLAISAELVSEQSVTLANRAGTAALGGKVSGKTGVSFSSAGDAVVTGTLVSGTTLNGIVTGMFTNTGSGALLADGDISLSASSAIINEGVISSAQALGLFTPNFSSIGTLESGRAFALTAQSITLAGRVASTDSITLAATNGALDLGAALQGTDVALSALGGDLSVRSGINIDATGLASLTSNRNISVGGIVTGNRGVTIETSGGGVSVARSAGAQSLADVRVAASDAVTNTGALAAGGNVGVSGSSISSGAISADGAVTLDASGAISVDDIIDAGTSARLTSTGGAISVGAAGSVLSGGGITLSAATTVDNAGDLSAETIVDASAGSTLTNSGFIFSRAGATRLGSARLVLGGDVYSATSLALNSNDIVISGSVGSNAAFDLTTNSLSIVNGGLLQSNRAITLSLGTAQIDGTLRALGSLGLNASGLAVGDFGLIEANTSLSATVTGTLNNRGAIGVTGMLDLSAGALTTSLNSDITATSDARISGGILDVSGLFQSGRTLSVTSNNTSISGTGVLVAAGSLGIDSGNVTNAGSLFANGAVSVIGRSALTTSGDITSNLGSVSLASGGAATIASQIDAKTSATITGGSVTLSGDIVADGAVGVTATSSALGITSNISSGNAITLGAANGDLSLGGGKTLFGASGITANARSIDARSDLLSPGAIALNATNALGLSGNLISNDAARLMAGTTLSLDGNIDAASANLSAGVLITRGNVDVTGAVALSAVNAASIGGRISAGGPISFTSTSRANIDVTNAGRLISGNAITLQNVAGLSVSGLVSAATNVSADYAGTATILGRVEAGNDISLTNNSGAATSIGGVVAAGNDIVINGGTLSIAGLAYAGRDFSFATGSFDGGFNSLTVDGTLAAGRNIGLSLAGGLQLGRLGLITADGNISSTSAFAHIGGTIAAGTLANPGSLSLTTRGDLGSGADFTLSGSLTASGALSVTAARGIDIAMNGLILSDRSVSLVGPDITAFGTIGAGDLVSINSGGNLVHGGLIQSGRQIAVSAGGSITLQSDSRIETVGNAATIGFARDAGASANIDVRAGGAINAAGTLFSDGAIALKSAASNITNSGTITGANDVVLQADSGAVINSGAITGSNLALYQGVDFSNSGSFTAVGNLLLSAPSITNSGLLGSGGSLVLLTPGALINQSGGTIFAGGALGIEAGGGITNDLSTILAVGDIGLTAPSLLNSSARIESLGGSVTIEAQNVVNQIKTLVIDPGVGGTEGTPAGLYDGQGNFGGPIPDEQDCREGNIICSGGLYIVSQAFLSNFNGYGYTPGTYTFQDAMPGTGGGDDIVTTNSGASQIIAARDVTITTGSNSVGTVTNSNSSILAGRNISITAGTLNNVATLLNRTRTEEIIERQIRNFREDASMCPPEAIPGTCVIDPPPAIGARYQAYVDVVVGTRVVNEQVPLPTLINAGGTVFLDVGTLNNNQPALNGQAVNGTGGGTPGVKFAGAGAQGGRGGFVDPNAPTDGVTGRTTAADTANGGQAAQAAAINVNFAGGAALINAGRTGNGAEGVGTAVAAMVGAGSTLLDAGAAGAAVSGGTDGAGAADQRGAAAGVTLADGSAGTGTAGLANGANANGVGTLSLTGPGGADVRGTNAGGGNGVGTGIGVPGGFVNSLIGGLTGGNGAAANGAGVSGADLVTTAGIEAASLPGGVQTAAITGVDAVNANTTVGADLTGMAVQNAQLVEGFGGLAIPGILGSNGQAGGFVFDFLAQFGLTAGANGFGIAGGGSLFTFNNNPDSQFLFTTNPGFGSVGELFDSTFFFDQLGIDRSTRFTRLGDGFFEAQLIGKQVQAATGQAQLGAFSDAFAQARGLLQAGAAEAKRLQLSVGVALTAAQVADLKTSLVWYVKSTVQGREVLVPVVYLAASDQKSIKGGAIISGANIVANVSGSITNNGTISASRVVSLTAGGDIVNQAGGRIAGGTVIASAARDILASGGSSISGGNILLAAGRDISLTATTSSTSTSERKDFGKKGFTQSSSTTQTVTGAEIAATGNLVMSAGRDITLTAAKVSAGGPSTNSGLSLSAGRDVNITGVTTTDTTEASSRTVKKGFLSKKVTTTSSSSSTETFNGTSLTAGGNLSIAAGNTLAIKGSDLASGGNTALTATNGVSITSALATSTAESAFKSKRKSSSTSESASTNRLSTISAGGNLGVGSSAGAVTVAGADLSATGTTTLVGQSVNVSGVIDSASFDATSRTVKKGLASKKVTTRTSSSDTQAVVASTIAGDRVNVVATGGDITIKGSNIVSDNGTVVQATGAITVGTLEAKSSESQSVRVKKSGISLSGGGLFAGVAKTRNDNSLETVTNTGSLVGAANGDVTLNAGKALTITGSQVAAPGQVNLIGESVTIANATDTANSTSLSKSSSFGVSLKVNSPLIDGIKAATSLAKTATGSGNARTQAVAGVAAGLAVTNSVDAAKDAVSALKTIKKLGDVTSLGSVSATVGFSKSKSTSETNDQTVVGSQIAGGNVNIVAHGAGDASTIKVIGSSTSATGDLTLSAPGAISLVAAQEIDTSASKNKSSGASIGVTLSSSGLSPTASLNLGKGNSAGKDVTNIESVLAAGGTARVVTPGALSLEGAQLSANRVEVQSGSLAITSQQDTSLFTSKQTSVGVSVSGDFGQSGSGSGGQGRSFNGAGASASFGSTRQSGDFASVAEQSGIKAGSGGFDIRVAGATTLTGAVIASEAAPENNQLTTGTLAATDLQNREKFKASSINLSASISGIGKPKPSEGNGSNGGNGNSTQVSANGDGNPSQGADRSRTTAGLRTGLGTISAGLPSVASASGSQASTTLSAIAAGGITLTSGDSASANVAQTISRDTSAANEALTKQFTDAKRADIAEGFAATQALTQQIGIFFNNRAADEADLRRRAEDPNAKNPDGTLLNLEQRAALLDKADKLKTTFGGGSAARILATAFSGAAGSNVAGGLGNLAQDAAVNVIQSLAVKEIKDLADGYSGSNTERETLRSALQAVVGCAGTAAGGNGGCGSAAAGAAASVIITALINEVTRSTSQPLFDKDGNQINRPDLYEQQARTNLVATIIAAIAAGTGLSAASTTLAAQIEIENNANGASGRVIPGTERPGRPSDKYLENNSQFVRNLKTRDPRAYIDLLARFNGIDENAQIASAAIYLSQTASDVLKLGGDDAVITLINGTYDQLRLQLNPELGAHRELLAAAGLGRGDGGPVISTRNFALARLATDTATPTAKQLDFAFNAVASRNISLNELPGFLAWVGLPQDNDLFYTGPAAVTSAAGGLQAAINFRAEKEFVRNVLGPIRLSINEDRLVQYERNPSLLNLLPENEKARYAAAIRYDIFNAVTNSFGGADQLKLTIGTGNYSFGSALAGVYNAVAGVPLPLTSGGTLLPVIQNSCGTGFCRVSENYGTTVADTVTIVGLGARSLLGGGSRTTTAGAVSSEIAAVENMAISGTGRATIITTEATTIRSLTASYDLSSGRVVVIDSARSVRGSLEYEILNTPPPNARIVLSNNGNVYVTNSAGIVDEIRFQPRLVTGTRDARQTAVGQLGLDTDVGGHAQACSLGGTCDRVNLFPQDRAFNNREYKKFENEIRRALERGDNVEPVTVRFIRSDPSNPRPDRVDVTRTINGRTITIPFRNQAGG